MRGDSAPGNAAAILTPTLAVPQVLAGLLSPATLAMIGGALLALALGIVCSMGSRRAPTAATPAVAGSGVVIEVAFLLVVLAMLATLQMFGGGPGSSMGRFTDFANPIGLALGVVLLTTAWSMVPPGIWRGLLGTIIAVVAVAALYLGASPVLALPWRASTGFLLGQNSYASMNEVYWDTQTAQSLARSLPHGSRAELLNFLPGFTAVPSTPFQRPDGCVYLTDYTRVLYGSADESSAIYASSNIDYFLFDVGAESPVVWSGFAPLFTPQSIESRMRLVTHVATNTRDLYLLTWRHDAAPTESDAFNTFLGKWAAKLASERNNGSFSGSYDYGAQHARSR